MSRTSVSSRLGFALLLVYIVNMGLVIENGTSGNVFFLFFFQYLDFTFFFANFQSRHFTLMIMIMMMTLMKLPLQTEMEVEMEMARQQVGLWQQC